MYVRKTGYPVVRVTTQPSQDFEYELGKHAPNPLETLKIAWPALPVVDLFHLRAFIRRATELIPGVVYLQLYTREQSKDDTIQVSSDKGLNCRFSISNFTAGVGTVNQGKVVPVIIKLSLKGTPTQQDDLILSARQQIIHMKETLTSKLIPRIEGVLFADANDLAQAVADEVDSAKADLAKHLVVRILKVETEIPTERDSATSDQHGNAARGEHEGLEYPADGSSDHGSGSRSTVPAEMLTNSDDSAHQGVQIEASSATTTGDTQAATLKDLMRKLDGQLSSPSPSPPAQPTSASPPTSLIDATTPSRGKMERGVVVALGSNVGNRIEEIEKACRAIDADPDMRIVDTSFLYETKPMYVEDQERFVNGACEVSGIPQYRYQPSNSR
jgi:hypothetical protein